MKSLDYWKKRRAELEQEAAKWIDTNGYPASLPEDRKLYYHIDIAESKLFQEMLDSDYPGHFLAFFEDYFTPFSSDTLPDSKGFQEFLPLFVQKLVDTGDARTAQRLWRRAIKDCLSRLVSKREYKRPEEESIPIREYALFAIAQLVECLSGAKDKKQGALIEYYTQLSKVILAKSTKFPKLQKTEKVPLKGALSEEGFWKLIDKSRKASDGDCGQQADYLVEELGAYSGQEIRKFNKFFFAAFNKIYHKKLWDVASELHDSCSDDMFDYLCVWLVGQGSKVIEEVKKNPRNLCDVLKNESGLPSGEDLMYVGERAYEEATGGDLYEKGQPPELKLKGM